ncbi:response regulator transcription factor [Chloroflexota bacterium]
MAKKILVVDDEPAFLRLVTMVLKQEGYEILTANNGQEALKILFDYKPDLVLLDVMMPKMDGRQTCARIREISELPVVMLTGKQTSEEDVVRGLDFGADDYLLKPIGNKELLARVRVIMRRSDLLASAEVMAAKEKVYSDGNLGVDVAGRVVLLNGERIKLTPNQFRLVAILIENIGRVITHRELLEKVWGWEYTDDLDYVGIYVSHLRQKIEPAPANPKYMITQPGVGYYFQKAG